MLSFCAELCVKLKKEQIHNCFNTIAHCAEIPNLCAPQSIHPVASTTTVHWQRLYCIHGSRQILGNESSLVLQRTKHAERELMKRLFNAVQKNYHMTQEPQEALEIWGCSQQIRAFKKSFHSFQNLGGRGTFYPPRSPDSVGPVIIFLHW